MDAETLAPRLATPGDRIALGNFLCSSADARLERWIRVSALDRQLSATPSDDFRLLLFYDEGGELVAVTAHERNLWVADAAGDPLPGTEFKLVAISDRFRDGVLPGGRPIVAAILEATFEDIRQCARGDFVAMMVRPGNDEGMRVVERLHATPIGVSAGDEVFVLRLG